MTKATIQPVCRANNIIIGYFDGIGVFPRTVTEKNIAFYLYSNHFCLTCKPENVSFNQAFRDLKDSCKGVDNFKTD